MVMFKSIFRGCKCQQCRWSRKKADKKIDHRQFRRRNKEALRNGDYEVQRMVLFSDMIG